MPVTAIYPGTFDPVTNGHLDLIIRAANLFDHLIVAVASNLNKAPLFDLASRVDLLNESLETTNLKGKVQVEGFDGLLIDFARSHQAKVLVRGLRAVSDFEFEFQLASMNRALDPDIESLFLMPGENYAFVSSTLVKEVAKLHGDVSRFVPPGVLEALGRQYQ